ncbi:MAG: SPFH domain-containing protein [Caulobacteraceae bacterium]
MSRQTLVPLLALFAVALAVAADSVFMLSETEQAVIVRLGKPLGAVNVDGASPGLHWKAPLIDRVQREDRRIIIERVEPIEAAQSDGPGHEISLALFYRITDPVRYRASFKSADVRKTSLQMLTRDALREAVRDMDAATLSSRRATAETRALAAARARLSTRPNGLTLERIVFTRLDMTPQEQAAAIKRMQAENRTSAAEARTVVNARSETFAAETARMEQAILDEARARAAATRAQTGRSRDAILSPVEARDPAFVAYYREMRAYESALANNGTTLVLTRDSPLIKQLGLAPGGSAPR